MNDHYKISAPDGTEYFVKGLHSLQQLYREGRIAANVLIQKLPNETWMPMNEMYDVGQWNTAQMPDDQTAETNPGTPYGFGATQVSGIEVPSNRGIRAAGILMLANSVISILGLLFVGIRGARGGASGIYPIAFVIDILVGFNLLRGQWRSYAIFRLCVGAVVYGIVFPLINPGPQSIVIGIFQILFCGGFLILLYKEFISVTRMATGIAVVVFCWLSISISSAVFAIYPALNGTSNQAIQPLSQINDSALPIQHFESDDKSASLNPPDGWVLLKKDNPIVPAETAQLVAVNPQSDCYAILIAENITANLGDDSVSLYISLVEENQKKSVPSFTVLNQTPTQFGNNTGQRLEVTWQHEKTKVHGWRSFCKNGNNFYMLSGWCLEGEQTAALPKYIALEKAFSVTAATPGRR